MAALCEAPDYDERQRHNGPYQRQRAPDGNAHEPERKEEEPHDGIEHQRGERQRPTQ